MLEFSIYRDQFVSAEMQLIWSESSTIASWLRVEQALAGCQAELGMIPQQVATQLQQLTCDDLDMDELRQDMVRVGRPVVGLVRQLKGSVAEAQQASVHYGSTTQDIMDTAMVLQMDAGLKLLQRELDSLIRQLAKFDSTWGDTEIVGRTNGQHAVEMTLGAKLAVWRSELRRRQDCMAHAAQQGLNVQCGGPVGDLRAFPEQGKRLKQNLAQVLGLHTVEPHWQNARDGVAEIIASLGLLCSSLCKIAQNINLLSSSEIGELFESPAPGKGGSSSMPHKRNQRGSEFMEALARQGRQQAAAIHETGMHQHERSGGVWISEWLVIPMVFNYTSGALMWANRLLSGLEVDRYRAAETVKRYREQLDG